MKKPWKIGLGVLAGAYAVAQAVRLVVLSDSTAPTPRSPDAQAYAAGNFMGSVIGLAVGAVACVLLIRSAFRDPPGAGYRRSDRADDRGGSGTPLPGRNPWDPEAADRGREREDT